MLFCTGWSPLKSRRFWNNCIEANLSRKVLSLYTKTIHNFFLILTIYPNMIFLFSSLQNICSLECIIAYIVCGWVVTIPSSLLQSHSLQLFRTCIIFVSNFFQNFKYIFSLTWIYFIYFHLDIFHIFSPECISYIFTWIYFIYFHLDPWRDRHLVSI